MAITKIKAIRSTVDSAMAYIINPAKTDEKLLVSSFGCSVETAAKEFERSWEIAKQHGMPDAKILARHVIQSFDVSEVSPELAHEIGRNSPMKCSAGSMSMCLPHTLTKTIFIIISSLTL